MKNCELTGLPTFKALSEVGATLLADKGSDRIDAAFFDVDGLIYLNDERGFEAGPSG